MKKAAAYLLRPAPVAPSAAAAKADAVTFNRDPAGVKANGFQSVPERSNANDETINVVSYIGIAVCCGGCAPTPQTRSF